MTAHDPALVGLVAEALDRFTHVDLAVPFARGNVARAVLDAITTSPRRALVELPEPYNVNEGTEFENGRADYALGDVSVFADGEIHVFGKVWHKSRVERFAADLLAAAARAAESGSTTPENKE